MQVKLTENWRGFKAGDVVDVTPGQRRMVLVLKKGNDYEDPPPTPIVGGDIVTFEDDDGEID